MDERISKTLIFDYKEFKTTATIEIKSYKSFYLDSSFPNTLE